MTFVSQSTVWEAANTLRRQGIPPSVRKIREALGGGSLSDIQAELKRWRAQYVTTDEDTGRDPILSLVNDLYDTLTQRVSQEMTQREQALTAKVDAYESHKAAIDLALHQQEQEIKELKAALAKREAVESRLTSERDEARAKVVALNSERDHLKRAQAQGEAELADVIAALESARSAKQAVDDRNADLKRQAAALEKDVKQLTSSLAQTGAKHREEIAASLREIALHKNAVSDANARIDDLRAAVAQGEAHAQHLSRDLEALRTDFDRMINRYEEKLDAAERHYGERIHLLKDAETREHELQKRLSCVEAERDTLSDIVSRLSDRIAQLNDPGDVVKSSLPPT